MDVGWQEVGPNKRARLIVLELKGIGVWATKPDDPVKPHEHLVKTCVAKELLLAVGEAVNGLLAGRAATAGVRWVSVIDFEGAQKLGLPVTRAP